MLCFLKMDVRDRCRVRSAGRESLRRVKGVMEGSNVCTACVAVKKASIDGIGLGVLGKLRRVLKAGRN